MKRLTGLILMVAVVIALAGSVVGAIAWVVATTQGARWLLAWAAPVGGVSFFAQKVEGRLVDHLLLTGVRLGLGQQKLEFDTLELRWKPVLLLTGAVAIQELIINGVRIQDDAPPDNKPPKLTWPKVPETLQLFGGRIERLQVTNVSYRLLQEEPLPVTSIKGSVTWQGSILSVKELNILSPSGRIQGSVSAGFKQPSIRSELAIALAKPWADMDRFTLQTRQSKGIGHEQFVGNLTIAGSAGTRKLLELSGDVGLAQDTINLRRLTLTRPGQKGRVSADGSLALVDRESILTLQIKAVGFDLAPALNEPTNLSGTLRFAGTLDSYRGDFTLANQAQGWQAATVSAVYQGTREGMKLARFTGSLLDGSLAGNMNLDWREGFSLQGALTGKNLNPARIAPDWKGVVNFNAAGELAWSGNGPLRGRVSGTLRESSLHGQALTGEFKADFADNNLSLSLLTLHGKGFDLRASGELNRRLALTVKINDFSGLIPEAAGTLQSEGWVRWRDGELGGELTGTGSRLAYAGVQIAAAKLALRFDQGTGHPMQVAASLRDLTYDGYKLNAVTLAVDGTLPLHTLNATLRSSGSGARLTLNGGYNAGVWKGEINRLAGSDRRGSWEMTAPTACVVSARNFSVSPLILSAGASERLEVAANLALNPLSGPVRAQWSGIDLVRLKPWLPPDAGLEGRISGRAEGVLLPGQRFELDGNAVLSEGTLHRKRPDGELKLSFTSAKGSWNWRGDTLAGSIDLSMAEQSQARANFQLPLVARFPIAFNPKGPLRASLVAQVQEKGLITAMFPALVQESSGVLDADINVGGTWEEPQSSGTVRLSKAGAYLPTAGIHLKDVQLTARLEKDLIRVDSFRALSGPGHIEGTALITLAEWRVKSYQGTIHGENFQTVHFPELQILSSPKLSFEGTSQKLKLRGDLRLPELNIVGAPSRTVVAPSSDVIMVGRVVPVAQSSALALDVQIKLLLGENVFVKVSGIDARLGGAIDLSLISLDRINSKGEIKVVKGRYRTYGVNLDIVRGRLYFAGGPINSPSLDFLALRTIGDVRAGVTVTGTLRKPVTKLYSEPAMPDVDILAYIVLGHPLGSSGQQASLVAQASAALLSSGQAAVLQDQIKHQLGLSTLEMQSGVGGTTGAMGYKPLQVTPPGAIPAAQQSGITETVLTVGKYLTPQLYISYGKSLFTGSNLFRLRYDIFKHWQIETQTGSGESGADLYYKLEFK